MSRENNQMAYIAEITHLFPIKDADRIVKIILNSGWPVVVKKDEFEVGDLVVFCEIDSWVPNELAPFLTKPGHEPKEYNGVKGERIKAIRLKKTPSQGLVLPLDEAYKKGLLFDDIEKGFYLGDILGIQKWEAPEGFQAGSAKGNFPSYFKKSDQERIQNIVREVFHDPEMMEHKFEVTTKLDGSSMSVCLNDEIGFMVCSRNVWLKSEDTYSTFVKVAKEVFGENGELLTKYKNLQFLGELIGPSIQQNFEGVDKPEYHVFDIYDINAHQFLTPDQRHTICRDLNIKHVPVLEINSLNAMGLTDIDKMKEYAEGPSINAKKREGVVFKRMDGQFSFKCVADSYAEGH